MAEVLDEVDQRTLEAIEIYRAEHTTWNLDKLRAVFADNPTVWRGGRAYEGNEAVDKLLVEWASRENQRMEMIHDRVMVQGNLAACEWRTIGTRAGGEPIDMRGANIYELEDGRIKYLHIYREH